jgi:ribosome-binding factor A
MSTRTIRVNELIQREINDILRKNYQSEALTITITEVRVSPDLRDARVFASILGDPDEVKAKFQWLRRQASAIRGEVGRRVTLKFLPKFEYKLDKSTTQTAHLMELLDQVGGNTPGVPPATPEEDPDGAA